MNIIYKWYCKLFFLHIHVSCTCLRDGTYSESFSWWSAKYVVFLNSPRLKGFKISTMLAKSITRSTRFKAVQQMDTNGTTLGLTFWAHFNYHDSTIWFFHTHSTDPPQEGHEECHLAKISQELVPELFMGEMARESMVAGIETARINADLYRMSKDQPAVIRSLLHFTHLVSQNLWLGAKRSYFHQRSVRPSGKPASFSGSHFVDSHGFMAFFLVLTAAWRTVCDFSSSRSSQSTG